MAKERPPIDEMTLRQLRKVASVYNISRYSRMRKAQLLAEIKKIEKERIISSTPALNKPPEEQKVEATKFELGQEENPDSLVSVDGELGELPGGYGESRIVLMPRDPQWAYAYWDIPNEEKESCRSRGGIQLALRLYDVTETEANTPDSENFQEYLCDELAREWYIPISDSDRKYRVDIGYRCSDNRWLILASSQEVQIPPVYRSDWIEDTFITVNWEDSLENKEVYKLPTPNLQPKIPSIDNYLLDSVAHYPGSMTKGMSSYLFSSGVGMWGVGKETNLASDMGLSNHWNSNPSHCKFWLMTDSSLTLYGATEPNSQVSINGRPIKLNSDGSFSFQMSFNDDLIDYSIIAITADGGHTNSIHINFTRETLLREFETRKEAMFELLN